MWTSVHLYLRAGIRRRDLLYWAGYRAEGLYEKDSPPRSAIAPDLIPRNRVEKAG